MRVSTMASDENGREKLSIDIGVGPSGHRALLFLNNPHAKGYPDPTGIGGGYDILTAPDPTNYSVPVNRKSVNDGDVAVVYRVDPAAVKRDPGKIVAVARVTSSPWFNRWEEARINWVVLLLPPEAWISSVDMKASGLWTRRVPFSANKQASSPVGLNRKQWNWLVDHLPGAALTWLEQHAAD